MPSRNRPFGVQDHYARLRLLYEGHGLFFIPGPATGLFIEGSALERDLGHQPGLIDYAALAWIVSSLATLEGTLGSGLQASDDVREAAYTYHRERRNKEENGPDS